MTKPKRILFTGQSGIQNKGEPIIKDFIESYASFDKANLPLYIKIEDVMFDIYCNNSSAINGRKKRYVDLLKEPISVIVAISKQAFEIILEKIKNEPKDVFLNCHVCYYHLQTLEFIAMPSLKHLVQFNPSKIITFIDDIYDIHLRLRQPRELLVGSSDSADAMIFDLLKILDWRINEISMSRYLSTQLNILDIPNEHYVLSVKHMKATLYDLIYESDSKQTLYFSHPITIPRQQLEMGRKDFAYPIMNEIKELSEYLSSKYICFLPTTIDELRIKADIDNVGTKHFVYGLKERWEKDTYENHNTHILFSLPNNNSNPKRIPFGEETQQNDTVPYLLEVLFRVIDRQVSIRDKKLVEQCKVLFIYRPGFLAYLSKGVRLELEYYQLLNRTQKDRINCFIYYPYTDQNELKIKYTEIEINDILKDGIIHLDKADENEILSSWNDEDKFGDFIEDILLKDGKNAKIEEGTLARDPYAERRDFFVALAIKIKTRFDADIIRYKFQADVFIEKNNLKPHELIKEIEFELQNKKS